MQRILGHFSAIVDKQLAGVKLIVRYTIVSRSTCTKYLNAALFSLSSGVKSALAEVYPTAAWHTHVAVSSSAVRVSVVNRSAMAFKKRGKEPFSEPVTRLVFTVAVAPTNSIDALPKRASSRLLSLCYINGCAVERASIVHVKPTETKELCELI